MRAAILRGDLVVTIIEADQATPPSDPGGELVWLDPDAYVGPGFRRTGDGWQAPTPQPPPPEAPNLQEWASTAQAELDAQRQILDLLLLGGLDDDGGTIDGEIGSDLPDSGGTLDDLEGLDLETLPDSGETLDDLDLALEG